MLASNNKTNNDTPTHSRLRMAVRIFIVGTFFLVLLTIVGLGGYDRLYEGKIYPSVFLDGLSFGTKTSNDVAAYVQSKNAPFANVTAELRFQDYVATVSGSDLSLGYDATLSATQAYLVGRSGHWLSDLFVKLFVRRVDLTPYLRWDNQVIIDALATLGQAIDIPVQDALFQFRDGRVAAFRPSRPGRRLNRDEAMRQFEQTVKDLPDTNATHVVIPLSADIVQPSITTDKVNSLGIKELIGRGYSEFKHSIPGRVHNVTLAAAKINGLLIKPGDVFSFNDAVGDISAATGFQPAYIIKEGKTVLGDGGGVCQVSTTLFRAALAAGLPIVERRAHAYRVQYYEQAGFKAGLDATVFAPSVDLKIKNDTPGYILIQTKTDPTNLSLTFELYGTADGRKAEIYNHVVGGITPPPLDLYQDDPTLPNGVVKQVDFAAWGAKTNFQYKVTRGSEVLQDTNFASNFRPWQAVFLRGTQ